MHADRLRRLVSAAVARGAMRRGLLMFEWNIAGPCQNPHSFTLSGRDDRDRLHVPRPTEADGLLLQFKRQIALSFGNARIATAPLSINLHVRCRKCPACLRIRRRLWAQRASVEYGSASRTWLGSLTLSPESQYRHLLLALRTMSASAVTVSDLGAGELFSERHRAISPTLTKYIKRVRKVSAAPLRYMLVAEAHKSGLPHYHMLVHELDPTRPILKRVLSEQWHEGFSSWKLVKDRKGAEYASKYLSKDSRARVRASLSYGAERSEVPENDLSHRAMF